MTSGGTEANALAILGATAGREGRVVISGAEHPSVREPAARLAGAAGPSRGRGSIRSPPAPSIRTRARRRLGPGTRLVSVMAGQQRVRRPLSRSRGWPRRAPPARSPFPHRRRAGGGPPPHRRRGVGRRSALRSRPTRCTGPRAPARSSCARAWLSSPIRRGAARSGACARAPRTRPAIVGLRGRRAAGRLSAGDRDATGDRARCATGWRRELVARAVGARARDRRRGPAAAQHFGDPLRGGLGRGAAHPARSRGRRGLRRERLLERHAGALARAARSGLSTRARQAASCASRSRRGTTAAEIDGARPAS